MSTQHILRMLATVVVLGFAQPAFAQLFGERTFGKPLSRGSGPTSTGTVDPSRRFVRDNSGPGSFIGSDTADVRSFVGAEQGRTQGRTASAAATLRERPPRRVNRPRRRSRATKPYAARLETAFSFQAGAVSSAVRLQQRLESVFETENRDRFEVSLEGQTATLRGEAPSSRTRELAELLVLLEPGVDSVRNQMSVQAPRPRTPVPPAPSVAP